MKKEDLEKHLLVEHLTLAEIGSLYGKTRQTVFYWVKLHGIDTSTAERFNVPCDYCGKEFSITRKKWRLSKNHFHDGNCRIANMKNPDYRQNRNGQRIAHSVLEKIGRAVRQGEVVHHIDGDNTNNDISNLMVFPSHSEHLKYHHRLKYEKVIERKENKDRAYSSDCAAT